VKALVYAKAREGLILVPSSSGQRDLRAYHVHEGENPETIVRRARASYYGPHTDEYVVVPQPETSYNVKTKQSPPPPPEITVTEIQV
jgi:hypothetical protein